jgi:hypothetical protein
VLEILQKLVISGFRRGTNDILFWDFTQRILELRSDVSGQPIFRCQGVKVCLTLEDVPKRRQRTTDIRCVTSQKSEDLITVVAINLNFRFPTRRIR